MVVLATMVSDQERRWRAGSCEKLEPSSDCVSMDDPASSHCSSAPLSPMAAAAELSPWTCNVLALPVTRAEAPQTSMDEERSWFAAAEQACSPCPLHDFSACGERRDRLERRAARKQSTDCPGRLHRARSVLLLPVEERSEECAGSSEQDRVWTQEGSENDALLPSRSAASSRSRPSSPSRPPLLRVTALQP